MKTHAQLLSDFRRVCKDKNVQAADFDFMVNNVLPTFLRKLSRFNLHNSHIQYIPKLKLSLTQDKWEYDWLNAAKYSETVGATGDTAGLITLAGTKGTYFIAPGDLASYGTSTLVDYYILDTTATTIQLDASVGATVNKLYVYARPLYFTDAYLLESGGVAGQDEIPVKRSGDMQAPGTPYIAQRGGKSGNPMYRVKGDKIEISFNPETSDVLHLFYVPYPVKFDYSNSLMTALTNPTQLTDEANNALVWYMGKPYWTQKGSADEIALCQSMVDEILGTAGFCKGQIEW